MAIPGFQSVMLPLLQLIGDKKEHSLRETIDALSKQFKLTEEERRKLLPSGKQPIIDNRIGWARTYMKKAGLIESTRRSYFCITERGLSILQQNLPEIKVKTLRQFKEFNEFHDKKSDDTTTTGNIPDEPSISPEEALEKAYLEVRENLASDLLGKVKGIAPKMFENIVIDLLVSMGYGGSRKDAGEAVGRTGDEGIDGIIKEDRLGLDIIYVQAKRWENTVSRPEIQKFAGALQGQRAKKGIFITTSNFSKDALEYAQKIESKIILIDGKQLAQHMIDFNIGVSLASNYQIKRMDSDYFDEE